MGFPDRIERTVEVAHPPARVWAALTTAEGLGSLVRRPGDDRPAPRRGGADDAGPAATRPRCGSSGSRSPGCSASPGTSTACPTTTRAARTSSSRSSPSAAGTRLTVVETGFAQLPDDAYGKAFDGNTEGWASELGELVAYLDAA